MAKHSLDDKTNFLVNLVVGRYDLKELNAAIRYGDLEVGPSTIRDYEVGMVVVVHSRGDYRAGVVLEVGRVNLKVAYRSQRNGHVTEVFINPATEHVYIDKYAFQYLPGDD